MIGRIMIRACVIALGAATGWGLAGCTEAAAPEPPMQAMAGVYNARSFVVGDDVTAVNGLLQGGGMRLVLRADSTTGGTMWLPAEITGDTVRAYDLSGRWTVADSTVWLVTSSGYVEDMVLRRSGANLGVDDVFATKHVRITLSR